MLRSRALLRRLALVAGLLVISAVAATLVADSGDETDGECGAWRALAPSPLQRTEVGAALIGESIYVVGGFERKSEATTNQLARYDIASDSWELLEPLPVGVHHPGVTSHDGRLYVHGGYTDPEDLGDPIADLFTYDPGRDAWERLPDAGSPRAAHALVAHDGELLAIGGADERSERLATVESYDIESRAWGPEPAMPTGRNHLAAAISGDSVYAIGGRPGPAPGGLRTVERFDLGTRAWSQAPPLEVARSGFAAATLEDGRLVAFGGEELIEDGQTVSEVELLGPAGGGWERLPDMRTPRHGLGGAALGKRVYALEGGPEPAFSFSGANECLTVG